jgi:hypothetical protein
MKKLILILSLIACSLQLALAQDDLLSSMDKENPIPTDEPVTATFKGTRLITGHSVEGIRARHLNFLISHRFGKVSDGAYNLYGLDQASIRLGLEYGLTDRLMIGLGRSSFEKTFDSFLKYKLLRQTTESTPISISLFGSAALRTLKYTGTDGDYLNNTDRLAYTGQMLIARKFNESFSFQITPTIVHRNVVETKDDKNNVFACGFAGRIKLSRRVSFNMEYFYVIPSTKSPNTHNNLSMGFDIETGGHVFQLHFTNSQSMIEKGFIADTKGSWGNKDIYYGFNISRTFSFKK